MQSRRVHRNGASSCAVAPAKTPKLGADIASCTAAGATGGTTAGGEREIDPHTLSRFAGQSGPQAGDVMSTTNSLTSPSSSDNA